MKKVIVLHPAKNLGFSIGDRHVPLSENMPVEDAELIQSQYPGQYVEVVDVAEEIAIVEPTDVVTADVAPSDAEIQATDLIKKIKRSK